MHLLKYDPNAKTLAEVMPGEFAADPTCRYFYVEGKRAAVPVLTHDGIGEIVWEHPSYEPPVTDQHRATDKQWAQIQACLLELRDRIQQLEASQSPPPSPTPSPRPSALVDRVANAIYNAPFDSDAEARAVIREVASWLRSEYPHRDGYGASWAKLLDDHANQ